MCGRFVSISSPDLLAAHFDVDEVRTPRLDERYNVAPSQDVYAVVDHEDGRRLGALRWGLVPFWASAPGEGPTPINARLETVRSKRLFADSFARRRCIIPADGFYEWQRRESGPKQPYYLHAPDGAPLAFAGLWSAWRDREDPDAEPVMSCAILTTRAAGPVEEVHPRMPVVLPDGVWADWLDVTGADPEGLHRTLLELPAPELVLRPITTRVNNVRNEGPELLEAAR